VLNIGSYELSAYVISDGTRVERVLSERSIIDALEYLRGNRPRIGPDRAAFYRGVVRKVQNRTPFLREFASIAPAREASYLVNDLRAFSEFFSTLSEGDCRTIISRWRPGPPKRNSPGVVTIAAELICAADRGAGRAANVDEVAEKIRKRVDDGRKLRPKR
jgi:hypothetical protein